LGIKFRRILMIISKGKMKEKFPKNMSSDLIKFAKELEDMEEGESLTIDFPSKAPLHGEIKAMEMAVNVMGYLIANEYSSYQVILEGSKVRVDRV
jgi:hypothetical protein